MLSKALSKNTFIFLFFIYLVMLGLFLIFNIHYKFSIIILPIY